MRAIIGAIAGEAAMRKPADVKIMERAESLNTRRRRERGGMEAVTFPEGEQSPWFNIECYGASTNPFPSCRSGGGRIDEI